jgi:hypothetical protein
MIGGICLVLVFVCLGTSPVRAVVLLDDHFDDGVISTNTTGIGSGFTPLLFAGGTVTESGTTATLTQSAQDFSQIVSNDAVNAFGALPASTVWQLSSTGGLLDNPTGNRRVVLGLQTGATAAGALFLPLGNNANQAGLWVYLTNAVNGEPSDAPPGPHGNLIFVSGTGAGTSLAKWDWQTYNMNTVPDITVTLNTTSTTYDLLLSQSVTNLVGSLSGALPSAAPATVRVGIFGQIGGGTTTGTTAVDRITIDVVPEPASLAMLLLGIALIGMPIRPQRTRG